MEPKTINSEFLDNIEFIMMCRNIINDNHKLGGCLIRQPGCTTASLATYLDFWFNCLPLSTDSECRPICAISDDACFVRASNGDLVDAKLNANLHNVVATFKECKTRHKAAHDQPTLSDVLSILRGMIAENKIERSDLVGWQQYYMPAKLAVLERRNEILEEENQRLNALAATSEEALIKELPNYISLFKAKESQYINNINACRRKIDCYREFIHSINVCGVEPVDREMNSVFLRKMARDAIQYYELKLKYMVKQVYNDIPENITALPLSKINEMCGTHLCND